MAGGERLDVAVEASVITLASDARDDALAICAGAGISLSAGLPGGADLASELHADLDGRLAGYSCANPQDLLAVIEAAETASAGGREAVQRRILELKPFDTTAPALAHRLLALLVAEGAIRLLLTNWDTCVERGWGGERIQAARSGEEAEKLTGQYILKVHGCCTQPSSLLVSRRQLDEDVPLWADAHFGAQLTHSTMVFVGVGSIAGYAKTRIQQLATHVDHARIRVVGPSIRASWDSSPWQEVVPTLPLDRRIPMGADQFLDQLAREWTRLLVDQVRASAKTEMQQAAEHTLFEFSGFTAEEALAWLRGASHGWKVGESVVRSSAAKAALQAIVVLASQAAQEGDADGDASMSENVSFSRSCAVSIGSDRYEVLLCRDNTTTTAIEQLAVRRASTASVTRGTQAVTTVLCAAGYPHGARREHLEPTSVTDPELHSDELIGGAGTAAIRILYADRVLEAA